MRPSKPGPKSRPRIGDGYVQVCWRYVGSITISTRLGIYGLDIRSSTCLVHCWLFDKSQNNKVCLAMGSEPVFHYWGWIVWPPKAGRLPHSNRQVNLPLCHKAWSHNSFPRPPVTMYVYTYIYIFLFLCGCIYIYVYIHAYIYIHTYMYICIYTYMYTCIYMYIYIYIFFFFFL